MSSSSDDEPQRTRQASSSSSDDEAPKSAPKAVQDNAASSSDDEPQNNRKSSSTDNDEPKAKLPASSKPDNGEHDDLFGADLSSSDDGDETKRKVERESESSSDDKPTKVSTKHDESESDDDDLRVKRTLQDDAESDQEEEEEEAAVAEPIYVQMPKGASIKGDAYVVKFPNFLTVETHPFDPDYFEEYSEEAGEYRDAEGRNRIKLKCENAIRWRKVLDENGKETTESNAKFVRWSDGTMSLYVGSEMFDVTTLPMTEHQHLFLRQGAGLEAQALFKERMTFRPSSTDTRTHQKMVAHVAQRMQATRARAKVINVAEEHQDPEKVRAALARKEEIAIRAKDRRENQQRRVRERGAYATLSTSYLEQGSDEEGESIDRIKERYGGARRQWSGWGQLEDSYQPQHYGYESDSNEQANEKSKTRRIESDDEDGTKGSRLSGDEPKKKESATSRKRVIDSDSD